MVTDRFRVPSISNQEKVYLDIELMQEFADVETAEVFRKRRERRLKHKQEPQHEDKPATKSTL